MTYQLTWLAAVLRDAGLDVIEEPGWQNRGRGPMGLVRGIICHHTAGPKHGDMPDLGTLIHGRADLPGPLSQLGLARSGTWHIIAAGRCNHAGRGIWKGVTTGNSSFIGIEAENTGYVTPTSPMYDPWPEVQMDSYARGCAAILMKLKQPVDWCCGHKEYALPHGRKTDPTFDMNKFREDVAKCIGDASHDSVPTTGSSVPSV